MDIRDAAEQAIAGKIMARMERCPWELVQAARSSLDWRASWREGTARKYFRKMLTKYEDRLPEWLED